MRQLTLEIDEDMDFQRRSWRVQRVAWGAMVLLLLAAFAGFLGSGPASRASRAIPDLLTVEHQRFSRFQSPETLSVQVAPAATRERSVRLWLDRDYVDQSRIESIVPAPVRVDGASDRVVYEFATVTPGMPLTISFLLQPERVGYARVLLGIEPTPGERGQALKFWQVVYP
jgi:hypothetical protein